MAARNWNAFMCLMLFLAQRICDAAHFQADTLGRKLESTPEMDFMKDVEVKFQELEAKEAELRELLLKGAMSLDPQAGAQDETGGDDQEEEEDDGEDSVEHELDLALQRSSSNVEQTPRHYKMPTASSDNVCPTNFNAVHSAAACQRAVGKNLAGISLDTSLGALTFDTAVEVEDEEHPSGCFMDTGSNTVLFNSVDDTSYGTFNATPVTGGGEFKKICTAWPSECDSENLMILSRVRDLSYVSGQVSMRYTNVFPYRSQLLDLIVSSVNKSLTSSTPRRNGIFGGASRFKGKLGNLNLGPGADALVEFKFVNNGTDDVADAGAEFIFSIYDLDEMNGTAARETVELLDHQSAPSFRTNQTEVTTFSNTFTSSNYGKFEDNPEDPCKIGASDLAANKHVAFKFSPGGGFKVKFTVGADAIGGRNILFGGLSPLACPVNPYCEFPQ